MDRAEHFGIRCLFRQGASIVQVARQFGLPRDLVARVCRFESIEEEREYYARLILCRVSTKEIADHAQVTVDTVGEWRRRWRREPTLLPESIREEFIASICNTRARTNLRLCSPVVADRLLEEARKGLKKAGLSPDLAIELTVTTMINYQERLC